MSRSIVFADGENLTFRYQEMLAAGKIPRQDTVHVVDTFVWNSRLTRSNYEALDNVIRVHYYTSATGDHDKIAALQEQLSQQKFVSPIGGSFHYGQVVPLVFKKLAQSKKTRNVDIQIVIDIMRYAFTDAIERIYLASGDGDYAPLITEVMRRGKQVELLAFSSGLNSILRSLVDWVHILDDKFFEDEGH
ncbi:MAG: NYN domain-containing protein [Candidatus Competibacter sp.]